MTKREADQIAKLIASALIDRFDAEGLQGSLEEELITENERDKIIESMKKLAHKLSNGCNIHATTRDAVLEILYEQTL